MKSYDAHVHTKYSGHSTLEPADALRILKKLDYDGVVIADHDRIKGAFAAKRLNKDKNFEVVVGEEISTDCGHVLGFYLNREIKPGNIFDVVDRIRAQGGVVCISHPFFFGFRPHIKMKVLRQLRRKITALECFNGRNLFSFFDSKAKRAAKRLGLAQTAGSDSHFAFELGSAVTRFDDNLNFMTALKKRKTVAVGKTKLYGFAGAAVSAVWKRL